MTKSWKHWGSSARSVARVTMPLVEQEPHFRVMRWTRTIRGATFNRTDQCSTRRQRICRRSLRAAIALPVQQDGEGEIDDPAALVLAQGEQRAVEGGAQQTRDTFVEEIARLSNEVDGWYGRARRNSRASSIHGEVSPASNSSSSPASSTDGRFGLVA